MFWDLQISTIRASRGSRNIIDGQGLADLHNLGFGATPEDLQPITLSLDIRATHALRDELAKGVARFKAKAGAAAIMDVNTGEIIALASLPDYDPNKPTEALDPIHINRMNVGVYEMGSTFKALTIAMALDSGKVNLNSRLDARGALSFGRFKIHDYHAQNRALTVPEVFTYSSNVGTARMAMGQGVERHKAFLCARWASSRACARNFPRAPNRSCRRTGANSTR